MNTEIVIPSQAELTAYALDSAGTRTAELPVYKDGSGSTVIKTDGKYKACWYELVKKTDKRCKHKRRQGEKINNRFGKIEGNGFCKSGI